MTTFERSQRTAGLVQSDIRAMTRACVEVGGVNLGQGICDTPTPEIVKEAAQQAITDNRSTYTRLDGVDELRYALANKLKTFNKFEVDPESGVIVTIGATGALASTLGAWFNPGDELIVFEPFYGYHVNAAQIAQVVVRGVELSMPSFALDLGVVEAAISPKTRAILVNTPSNPAGKVFTLEELEAIAELCKRHDLLCITDEIYEYITYDTPHTSMATLPGMADRTITIGGYSKTFSITGWRIGYAAAAPALAGPIGLVHDLNYVCAPAPLQHGVAAGIESLPDSYYADIAAEYRRSRDQFCDLLTELELPPMIPDGAYYVLADVSRLGCSTSKEAAMRLLNEAKVASVPGSAFFSGPVGEQYVRFCFAKRQEELDRACDYLRSWHLRGDD